MSTSECDCNVPLPAGRLLGTSKDRITISQQDGVMLLETVSDPKTFVYADPPYLV